MFDDYEPPSDKPPIDVFQLQINDPGPDDTPCYFIGVDYTEGDLNSYRGVFVKRYGVEGNVFQVNSMTNGDQPPAWLQRDYITADAWLIRNAALPRHVYELSSYHSYRREARRASYT